METQRAAIAAQKGRSTFRELAEDWFTTEIEGRHLKHPHVPRRHLDNYLLPEFGDRAPAEITPVDAARLLAEVSKRAPTAANDLLRFMRRVFRFGVRRRLLQSNPVENMAAWMRALDVSRRGYFLALVSHQLTVAIRIMCYESQSNVGMIESIRALNEAHHRVAGYLIRLTSNDEDTGWLKPVAAYLATCQDATAQSHLKYAWDHSRSVIERLPGPNSLAG